MVAFVLLFIDSVISYLPLMILQNAWTSTAITSILYAALAFFIVIAITALVKIFFQAVITDDARFYWQKERKRLSKSFPIAKKKYLTVLLVLIFAGIISGFVSIILQFIPVAGGVLAFIASFLLALIFLFLIQIIIISNKGVVNSIKEGYNLFMKSKLDVFLFWLVLAILSVIIVIIAIIPMAVVLIPVIAQLVESFAVSNTADVAAALGYLIPMIKANMLIFAVAGIVSTFIFSYLSVFQESAKTFFYMQKKR
jgi:hypothetical protein